MKFCLSKEQLKINLYPIEEFVIFSDFINTKKTLGSNPYKKGFIENKILAIDCEMVLN